MDISTPMAVTDVVVGAAAAVFGSAITMATQRQHEI